MAPGKLSRKPRQRLLEVGFVAVVRRLAAERLRRRPDLKNKTGSKAGGLSLPPTACGVSDKSGAAPPHASHRPRSRLAGAKVLLRNG